MKIGAKFVAAGLAAHGSDDSVSDHESANVAAPAFTDETLNHYVLPCALQGFDDGLGHLGRLGQDHSDALRSL